MASTSISNVSGILKELYDDQRMQWLTYNQNPTLAMIKKSEGFSGKTYPNSVVYGLTQGSSATFANAYNNQTPPQVAEFFLTRVEDFSLATLDGQLLRAAASSAGAFIESSQLVLDACLKNAANRVASAIFRNGAGTFAQIASVSNVSGNNYLVTLANVDDSVQVEPGQTYMAIQFQDASGTAPTDTGQVTAVNRSAGTFNITSSTNIASNWPATYWLAVQGDLPNATNNNYAVPGATTNSLLKTAGFASWLPIGGVPSNDSFFGVNRNLDTQRLAGVSFDGRSLSLEEALIQGTSRVALNGGKPETGICSYSTFAALLTSMQGRTIYVDHMVGEIAFKGIMVHGANTTMNIFPDRNCPDGVIYALEIDSWVLKSAGPATGLITYMNDEIEFLRLVDSDAVQVRCGGYFNLACLRPGSNGVIQVQVQEF